MQLWKKNKIFKNYDFFFKYPAESKNPIKKFKKNSFLKFFHEFNANLKIRKCKVQYVKNGVKNSRDRTNMHE
jgi:hypothetical protein